MRIFLWIADSGNEKPHPPQLYIRERKGEVLQHRQFGKLIFSVIAAEPSVITESHENCKIVHRKGLVSLILLGIVGISAFMASSYASIYSSSALSGHCPPREGQCPLNNCRIFLLFVCRQWCYLQGSLAEETFNARRIKDLVGDLYCAAAIDDFLDTGRVEYLVGHL